MKFSRIMTGLLVTAAVAVPTTAVAAAQDKPAAGQTAAVQDEGYKPKISSGAIKSFQELQTAVNAKDQAAIAAKLPEAQAKAKTPDDKYALARLQLQAAIDRADYAGMVSSVEAIIATNVVPVSTLVPLYSNIGKLLYNEKQFAQASSAFTRILQLDPNHRDILLLQAEAMGKQGKTAEGLALVDRAIAAEKAASGKVSEQLLRFGFATAYNNKHASAVDRSIMLVTAYPTPNNWRDALKTYQANSGLENSALIDVLRLADVTDALTSESDYYRLANTALLRGFPGEAKTVLEGGFAKGRIDKNKTPLKEVYASAVAKSQGDRASLAASAKTALAAPTAKQAMGIADAYYGYGDYTQAAELYRAALTKGGVDKDLANLRLGMALARGGDKAGAKTALAAVGGAQVMPARFWLAYLGG